jgi:hypothetical protein
VPSTPAGAGLYPLFVVGTLIFFGVDKPQAAGFSLISFAVLMAPAVAGFFALTRCGLTLRQVQGRAAVDGTKM